MMPPVTRYAGLLPSLPPSDGPISRCGLGGTYVEVATLIVDASTEMTLLCSYPQCPSNGFPKLTCNA